MRDCEILRPHASQIRSMLAGDAALWYHEPVENLEGKRLMRPLPMEMTVPQGQGCATFYLDAPFFSIWRYLYNNSYFRDGLEWASYAHSHPVYEAHYVYEGDYRISVDGDELILSPGDLLIIAPGAKHELPLSPSPGGVRLCTYTFELLPRRGRLGSASQLDFEAAAALDALRLVGRYVVAPFAQHEPLLAGIRRELGGEQPWWAMRVGALLTALLTHMAAAADNGGQKPSPAGKPADTAQSPCAPDDVRMSIIDDFFNFNYHLYGAEELLAKKLFVSRRTLSVIMRRVYGMTFRQKLYLTRMEVAADMLRRTDCGIARIMERTGYGSESAFYSAFRRYAGTTPEKYRKAYSR